MAEGLWSLQLLEVHLVSSSVKKTFVESVGRSYVLSDLQHLTRSAELREESESD